MFIQVEKTPNPVTMKFVLPNYNIDNDKVFSFSSIEETNNSPLAKEIFLIKGINSIFIGNNFITVTKDYNYEWDILINIIIDIISKYLKLKKDIIIDSNLNIKNEEFFNQKDIEIVKKIKKLLKEKIKPSVMLDGGDISFKGFRNGIVYLSLKGACEGCPSSISTLKFSIKNLLSYFIPEVQEVESI